MSNRLSIRRRGWACHPYNPLGSALAISILEDVHKVLPQQSDVPASVNELVEGIQCKTNGLPLVGSNKVNTLLFVQVVDGLDHGLFPMYKLDLLLDLFLLCIVELLGNLILEAKRYLGILE